MSGSRILVADDEQPVRAILSRLLSRMESEVVTARDGEEALTLAAEYQPDLILLDVRMPKMDGWQVLAQLRSSSATRMTPVIMLTGEAGLTSKVGGLSLGADDYITKPFAAEEVLARVQSLLRRTRLAMGANPLTGLPGSPALEEEVDRRIAAGLAFALFHIDLDRFKSYNDAYGFARGDEVIRATAASVREAVADGFVSHIGGDDFAAVVDLEDAALAAQRLATSFDEKVAGFYAPEDHLRGYVESTDRDGTLRRFGLLALSIGIATTARRSFTRYAEAAVVASEMKSYLKGRPASLSRFAFDRRDGSNVARKESAGGA